MLGNQKINMEGPIRIHEKEWNKIKKYERNNGKKK